MDLVLAGSVDPVRSRRAGLMACGYLAASTAGGALLGALIAATAYATRHPDTVDVLRVALGAAFLGSIAQLKKPKVFVPQIRRQVSRQPLADAGRVKMSTVMGYGLQIGFVVSTFIRFPAFYVVVFSLALTQSLAAAFVAGVLIGSVRGASPLLHWLAKRRFPRAVTRSVSCRMNRTWDAWAVRGLALSATVLLAASFGYAEPSPSSPVSSSNYYRGGE